MYKKIKLILLCGVISLLICGCNNKEIEEIPFNMACKPNTNADKSIVIERYTNTLIIPKYSSFFEDDALFKGHYYCYNTDTEESVPDENIIMDTSNFNVNETGTYKIKLNSKYDSMVGNTEIEVKVIDSCSGTCTIKTSNWIFELNDNIKYQDISDTYRILNVPVKITPTDNAFYTPTSKTVNYSTIMHGAVNLRVNHETYVSKYTADDKEDKSIGENDNALAQTYIKNKSNNSNTYIKFRVVPIVESEAYIDFYDKSTDEHHFYFIHK